MNMKHKTNHLPNLINEYANLAPIYDRRWSHYQQQSIKATLDRLQVDSQGNILDLACGTGTLLSNLLEFVPAKNLFGIDISSEMLAIAQEKLAATVHLEKANSEELPFANNHFQQVISTNSLHYFQQPQKVLQEIKRVLKPGGELLITDWCHDFFTCRILDLYLRCFNKAHFYTYSSQELKTLLRQENFKDISVDPYKINWFWGMMSAKAIK